MTGDEEKYTPNFGTMDMYQIKGAAKAAKNMADRRFAKFEGDIQVVIEMKMFDEDNYQLVKELKRDVEENIIKYEEILTHLEGFYYLKQEKYTNQLKEMKENFDVMDSRRSTVWSKGLEAVKAIEEEKNKKGRRVQGRTGH